MKKLRDLEKYQMIEVTSSLSEETSQNVALDDDDNEFIRRKLSTGKNKN